MADPAATQAEPAAPSDAPAATVVTAAPPPRALSTMSWVSTTYFAEGFPYMIVRWLASVYATDIGLPETVIGSLNLLGIPWNIRPFWAPLVDWIGTKRGWLVKTQLFITLVLFLLAALVGIGPAGTPASAHGTDIPRVTWAALSAVRDPRTGLSHLTVVAMILACLVVLAIAAATNDVTIDGFYIEGLPDRRDQAAYSGLRVLAYRIAVLFAKTALIGFSYWAYGFGLAAVVMGVLTAYHAIALPRFKSDVEQVGQRKPFLGHLWEAIRAFLDQPRIVVVLGFIATYKIGDSLLFSLNSTFLLRELHVTRPQLGWLAGVVGTICAILGTISGAWLIRTYGLRRTIWPLTLAMNLTIWAYVWLAFARPDPTTTHGFGWITFIHGYEQLAGGLGDAAFTVFLLYTCKPQFKAAHYAIGAAMMSFIGNVVGGTSGWLVLHTGYTMLYVLAFAASIPGMALLVFLPIEHRAGLSPAR